MLKPGIRYFLCITILSLGLLTLANGQSTSTDEVERALAALGSGSAGELKNRLFTFGITVFDDKFRTQSQSALPDLIRNNRITQGKLLRRVELIFSQLLHLHGRNDGLRKPELFLFQNDLPSATLWRGCVLAISDGLADPLYDGELAGIMAHELGHSYFEDEMAAARRTKDARTMRVVELKCDAVALISLKLLGHDPALYLRGLDRIRMLAKRKGQSGGIFQSHPELVERVQFSQRFIKFLS